MVSLVKNAWLSEQELNITPKPTKNETKATLKVTQATEAKAEKEAKEAL